MKGIAPLSFVIFEKWLKLVSAIVEDGKLWTSIHISEALRFILLPWWERFSSGEKFVCIFLNYVFISVQRFIEFTRGYDQKDYICFRSPFWKQWEFYNNFIFYFSL